MQIAMTIKGLMVDPVTNMPIIILRDEEGSRVLPIWVGIFEANAIALQIENVSMPRPMTHDLLRNVILEMGASVERVIVTELRDNTFFATINMKDRGGEPVMIDARPSDAIALALRVDCPIFVNEEVIRASRNTVASGEEESVTGSEDEWPDVIGEAGDLPM